MHPAQPTQSSAPTHVVVAYERRRRAAWIDYLRCTREAPGRDYEHAEADAWVRLQRRLLRNDELLAEGR